MIHQRTVIREAIVAALVAANTLAATRVFDTPYDPRSTFPALTVEDDVEDQSADNFGSGQANRYVERAMRVVISAEIQQIGAYARTRDSLLGEVEAALASTAIAGVKSITPAGYQADLGVASDRPIAIGRQRFDVVYITTQGNPATAI